VTASLRYELSVVERAPLARRASPDGTLRSGTSCRPLRPRI